MRIRFSLLILISILADLNLVYGVDKPVLVTANDYEKIINNKSRPDIETFKLISLSRKILKSIHKYEEENDQKSTELQSTLESVPTVLSKLETIKLINKKKRQQLYKKLTSLVIHPDYSISILDGKLQLGEHHRNVSVEKIREINIELLIFTLAELWFAAKVHDHQDVIHLIQNLSKVILKYLNVEMEGDLDEYFNLFNPDHLWFADNHPLKKIDHLRKMKMSILDVLDPTSSHEINYLDYGPGLLIKMILRESIKILRPEIISTDNPVQCFSSSLQTFTLDNALIKIFEFPKIVGSLTRQYRVEHTLLLAFMSRPDFLELLFFDESLINAEELKKRYHQIALIFSEVLVREKMILIESGYDYVSFDKTKSMKQLFKLANEVMNSF